jgi:deazaflavin-dependent oxidoreductase (nitroreductase family)
VASSPTLASPAKSRMHRFSVHGGAMALPVAGRRFFPLYGVIHHIGRKSGTEYDTPVVVREATDGIYVPLPFGESTNWYRNAVAAGGIRVTWKGRDQWFANPTVVDREAARPAFNRAMNAMMAMSGAKQVIRFDPIDDGAERR